MLKRSKVLVAAAGCLALFAAHAVHAHFIWLSPEATDSGTPLQIYFAEDANSDDPALLSRLEGIEVKCVDAEANVTPLEVQRTDEAMIAILPEGVGANSVCVASHDLGVITRGDAVFRLKYYAKVASASAWSEVDCTPHLQLDVVPTLANGQVRVQATFAGQPVDGAQVIASGPGMDDFEGTTNAEGVAEFTPADPGIYSIRVRHIEAAAGELEGQTYSDVRHYCTATFNTADADSSVAGSLPALEQPVTSFGAAIVDGNVYIYGGHTGGAHSYSMEEQERFVRKLDLEAGTWEQLAEGPPLQGLALVAHGEKLYRIGGFTAMNAAGEEHDLQSQDGVAGFDLATGEWSDLAPLPEPRSSFDAAVLDDKIYVIGGWSMGGAEENEWLTTAWAMDLSADAPAWESLPAPPFQRRALAVAAHEGKIYAIGGMQPEGGPTRRTDVFDPATGQWTLGPELIGEEAMTGFGASAFATGGRLYVTAYDGSLQRLTEDGSAWEVIAQTPTARFFHRMLPIDDHHLLMVGGANMGQGKFAEVEVLTVSSEQ
jgi:N-acetylneuraminic acid mutarotase